MSHQSHTGQEGIAHDRPESDDAAPTDETTPTDEVTSTDEPEQSPRRPCAAPPETWESVGRAALVMLLEDALDDLSRETRYTASAVRRGESVTEDDFLRIRDGVEGLQLVVEDLMTDLSPEVEPYERTAGRIPAGRLRAAMEDAGPGKTGNDGSGV